MEKTSGNNEKREKPGPSGSGEQETGQNYGGAGESRTGTTLHLVERVTALRGQSITRPQQPKSVRWRHTQSNIYGKDPEIPYVKFEAAASDLVCSLMERQDRMNVEIFYKINDLVYRIEDLEQDRNDYGGGR
jgi:hypothetical protein